MALYSWKGCLKDFHILRKQHFLDSQIRMKQDGSMPYSTLIIFKYQVHCKSLQLVSNLILKKEKNFFWYTVKQRIRLPDVVQVTRGHSYS